MDVGEVGQARTARTSRRIAGDRAEEAVAAHLAAMGWRILFRNVRVGRCEVDIVALDAAGALVIVEVRSRSAPGFGAPEESVDAGKVARLYSAGWQLTSDGRLPNTRRLPDGQRLPHGHRPPGRHGVPDGLRPAAAPFRVDLVTVVRQAGSHEWTMGRHLRGLAPT